MADEERMESLPGWVFGKALVDAGIIGTDVRRVVIDVPSDGPVRLYVERIGSRKLLKVVPSLEGVRIETVDDAPATTPTPGFGKPTRRRFRVGEAGPEQFVSNPKPGDG